MHPYIIVVGGPSGSDVWMQILSDIIQKPIKTVEHSEGASFGNAILAGKGLGIYSDLNKITEEFVKIVKTFNPNNKYKDIYENIFKIYCRIYKSLKKEFNDHDSIISRFNI